MTELELARVVPGTPERVWRAFTDPDEVVRWFWPSSYDMRCLLELRLGAPWRFEAPGIGLGVGGEVLDLEDVSRLVLSWRWDGDDHASRAELRFDPDAEGTRIGLTHGGLVEAERASHLDGWTSCLDRLPPYLEELRPQVE